MRVCLILMGDKLLAAKGNPAVQDRNVKRHSCIKCQHYMSSVCTVDIFKLTGVQNSLKKCFIVCVKTTINFL